MIIDSVLGWILHSLSVKIGCFGWLFLCCCTLAPAAPASPLAPSRPGCPYKHIQSLNACISTEINILKNNSFQLRLTLCPLMPGRPGVPGNPRAPCHIRNIFNDLCSMFVKKKDYIGLYDPYQNTNKWLKQLHAGLCLCVLFTWGPGGPRSPDLPGLPASPWKKSRQRHCS